MITPERTQYALEDGVMAAWRWPNRDKPILVFAHANGFNGGVYRQMLQSLSDRFEIIAPDLRGHGRTTLPAAPDTHENWHVYARDLLALYGQLDRSPTLLGGHSMGASSTLLAAARMASPPALALVEPVVLPPLMYLMAQSPLWPLIKARLPMGRQARARSNRWADREAVLERYGSKTTFANWAEGVLEHYLEDGLTVTADGVRLSCDPFWEAANFEAQSHGLLPAVKTLGNKVHVLRAETGSTTINAAGMTARGAQITPIEGGHLIAMENPQAVSDWIHFVADLEGI